MADPYRPGSAYPPPGNPNGGYPPPGNSNGGEYHPPSTNSGGYPPPSTNYNGGGYPAPGTNFNSNYPPLDTTSRNAPLAYPPPSSCNTATNGGAVVGYPYVAQPPPQHYYPTQSFSDHSNHRACFRRLCIILILLLIVAGLIVLILWLVFRPRLPVFRVDNLTVKDLVINGTALSGTWEIAFTATNPNSKMTVSYDKPLVALFFRHAALVDTFISPFKQDKKNEMPVKASLTATHKELDSKVMDQIKYERKKTGHVEFDVKMLAKMGLDAGIWKSDQRKLKISCAELFVSLSNNSATGSLVKGPTTCIARL